MTFKEKSDKYKYYAFNKPFGYISACKDDNKPVIMEFFPQMEEEGLFPVGRLDRETEGLIFVTNDGQWFHNLIHPESQKEKRYEFTVLGDITEEIHKNLEGGVKLTKGEETMPCRVAITWKGQLKDVYDDLHEDIRSKQKSRREDYPVTKGEIVITEGKKRQIRRMMRAFQCTVLELRRLEIQGFHLPEDLKSGEFRELTREEAGAIGAVSEGQDAM